MKKRCLNRLLNRYWTGSGIHGGEIVSSGTDEVMQDENSITGRYLSGKEKIDVPTIRRKGNGKF